jgi:ubiquinone/menaquinone biosynthesis C-methylase UbiE
VYLFVCCTHIMPSSHNDRPNLVLRYFHAMLYFRGKDFVQFVKRHDEMFIEAKRTGDHLAVTSHFYDMMGPLIEMEYGSCWHFAPLDYPEQTRNESVKSLHQRISRLLALSAGKKCLDIGCGMGGIFPDIILHTGCHITGLALSRVEVGLGNANLKNQGLDFQGTLVQGDAQQMPFPNGEFDAVYAIYSLKYFTTLDKLLEQVHRVLKPGGLFLVYAMMKTDLFDSSNTTHRKLIESFEYACGMPSLHTRQSLITAGNKLGLECVTQMDVSASAAMPWYYEFNSKLMHFIMTSSVVKKIMDFCEVLHILPRGFRKFMDIFVATNVITLPVAGKMGILTGSDIIVLRKRAT